MKRLTRIAPGSSSYFVDEAKIQLEDNNIYSGEAISRLAFFENFCYDLIAEQDRISADLEKLRNEGKSNSVKFKELLVRKLTNSNTLILLRSYGLQ